jgi:CARDB
MMLAAILATGACGAPPSQPEAADAQPDPPQALAVPINLRADLTPSAVECASDPVLGNIIRAHISNIGDKRAFNFYVTATFITYGGQRIVKTTIIPLLNRSHSQVLVYAVPPECFTADCSFEIAVDPAPGTVDEEHEDNNVRSGVCIG